MQKNILFTLAALFISISSFSQKQQVQVSKDTVLVNGENFLTIKKDLTGVTFADLEGNNLIFLADYLESDSHPAFTKIIFLKEKKMVTNQSVFISRKSLITMLLTEGVLVNGDIDSDALDIFILKYHEEIPTYSKMFIISDDK
jgi:hypothetical protein